MPWLLLAALFLAVPEREPTARPAPELSLQAIQGDWEIVKFLEGGMPVPEKMKMMSIRGNELSVKLANGEASKLNFMLDLKQTPCAIDLSPTGGDRPVFNYGIIRLRNDTLTIVINPDGSEVKNRPSRFTPSLDPLYLFLEVRRLKK